MTQSIEYVVKVNATQAQQAVAEVEKRFGGVDSVVARVDKRIVGLERDMKDLSAAIARGEGPVEAYRAELVMLERQMQSVVGGANRAGHALETMGGSARTAAGKGVGMGVLQLSQTLDDLQYGIRGIVNNIPGLVQGFGLSAGIAGGAQLAFIAVNQLTDKITAYIKKQQEATQEAIKFRLTLQDMTLASMGNVDDLGKKLERLKAVEAGGETAGLALDLNRKLADEAERRANAEAEIDRLLDVGRSRITKTMPDAIRNLTDAERNRLRAMQATVEQSKVEAEQAVKVYGLKLNILSVEDRIAAAAKARAKAERDAAKAYKEEEKEREERANVSRDMRGMFNVAFINRARAESEAEAEMEAEIDAAAARKELQLESLRTDALIQKMKTDIADEGAKERAKIAKREARDQRAELLHLSRMEQLEGESLAARLAFDTVAMDHKMDNLDRLKAHEFKNLKDTVKQYEGMYNDLGQLAQGATTTLIGASEDYFKAKIEGAENAEAIAAAAVLSGIGDQLVGLGTKYLFEGAGMSLLGDPRGPLMLGIGAGAIAAGVGMGAGSAAISHTAAGGTIGQALPDDKATKDPGASPRTSSGGSSGGPLIVNVSYGAGGPLPEDIAREIHKVTASGNRRRGAS